METIIKTESLTKIYNPLSLNPKLALDQVSLDVKEARIYCDHGEKRFRENNIVKYFINN